MYLIHHCPRIGRYNKLSLNYLNKFLNLKYQKYSYLSYLFQFILVYSSLM